jgi:AraC-like DNA-binding protein
MKWITRERPKIDRIACPWLIKRFIDKEAEVIFVPANQVIEKAKQLKATPFDIPDVEFTHYGDHCTFDFFVKKYRIKDPAILKIALIVRGADTDKFDLAMQSAGLWAISAGLSHNFKNDHDMLEKGMIIYDALYSWAKFHEHEKHTWDPMENVLLQVFNKFMSKKLGSKKPPSWAGKLKEIIQDQIDTNFSLTLKEISKAVNINPDYLSREFSKYFDSLSFGEYLRKLRVDKSIELLHTGNYSLSEIAYLTGFSDQSHFIRIFKKHTGMTPSLFKNNVVKKTRN